MKSGHVILPGNYIFRTFRFGLRVFFPAWELIWYKSCIYNKLSGSASRSIWDYLSRCQKYMNLGSVHHSIGHLFIIFANIFKAHELFSQVAPSLFFEPFCSFGRAVCNSKRRNTRCSPNKTIIHLFSYIRLVCFLCISLGYFSHRRDVYWMAMITHFKASGWIALLFERCESHSSADNLQRKLFSCDISTIDPDVGFWVHRWSHLDDNSTETCSTFVILFNVYVTQHLTHHNMQRLV